MLFMFRSLSLVFLAVIAYNALAMNHKMNDILTIIQSLKELLPANAKENQKRDKGTNSQAA